MPKYVASTTLGSSDWHDTTVISSDVEGAVRGLKEQDGGPILVPGSRTLVHFLFGAGSSTSRPPGLPSAARRGRARVPLVADDGRVDVAGAEGDARELYRQRA